MKRKTPVSLSPLLLCLFCLLLFASCTESRSMPIVTGEQTEAIPAFTETEAPTEPVTEPVTKPVTEPVTEPATEPVTEPVTESAEEQYPQTVEDDGVSALKTAEPEDGIFINPLSGLVCEQTQAELRPAAIMLNNIAAALPQQNIAAADVLYECEVEGGLTRLMGVYNDYQDLVGIGSVRSSREYYIDFAANHDAIYVHAGGSDSAYVNLKNRGINNIDGVNGGAVTAYFYRDPVRRQTMALEHTLVIDGKKLAEAVKFKKYRTSYAKSFENPLHFVGPDQTLVLTGSAAKAAETFTVAFGAHKTSFAYDAGSNAYLRSQNGKKQIDGVTEEQLAYENVIVLFCPYKKTNDDKNHITVADTGSGKGYLMTGGKYTEISWSKTSGDTAFRLTYPGGRDVYLTPGKTNIEIVNSASSVIFD